MKKLAPSATPIKCAKFQLTAAQKKNVFQVQYATMARSKPLTSVTTTSSV